MELWLEVVKISVPPVLAAWLTAYFSSKSERSKIDARIEKLETLIIERRELATAEEGVKDGFASKRLADERTREAYHKLISIVARAHYEIDVMSRYWDQREHELIQKRILEHAEAFIELTREALRDMYAARLYVSERSRAEIDEVLRRAFEPTNPDPDAAWIIGFRDLFKNAKDLLVSEADRELRFAAKR